MKLKEYAKKHNVSLRGLAKMFKVPYPTFYIIANKDTIAYQKNADKIIASSKGEITYKDLGYKDFDGKWVRPYGNKS